MSETIKDKIRKLLALAASDSVEEATLAMAKAQELMDRHNLNMAEMSASESVDVEPIIEDKDPFFEAGRMRKWKTSLASILARNNNCTILMFKSGSRTNPGTKLIIYGKLSDIDNTRFLFAFILNQLTRLSILPCIGSGMTYKDSWYLGAVMGIQEKLQEMKEQVKKEFSQFAVIKYENTLKEVDNFMRSKHKVATSKNNNKSVNNDAYSHGFKTGKDIDFGKNRMLGKKDTIGMR